MKRFVLTLSAFAAGTCAAQSSLTVFGVVDAGISRYTTKSTAWTPLAFPAEVRQRQTVQSPSGFGSSRIGFRGTEDLGGGLAASFWLEAPVANDSGANAISNFGRRSTVSLSGGFGEIRLGRDYTATFYNDAIADPMTSNGVGTNLIAVVNSNIAATRALATGGLLNGGLSAGTDSYLRTSNAVSYFLPPDLGGFYGQVQYALHENVKISDTIGSPSKRGRYMGARFGWSKGPADVAVSWGESTLASAFARSEKIKSMNLGATYDFGVAKLFGEWSLVRDVQDDRRGPVQLHINDRYAGWLAGVTVPVGPGLIRASYARVRFDNGRNVVDGDASANKLALGYVHHLSKRTALYATVARINISNGRNNPAVMGVTPLVMSVPAIIPQPTYVSTGGLQARSATGYDFGIRHVF